MFVLCIYIRYMKYGLIILIIALCSCEGSIHYREKHGMIKSYVREFEINSIRVDDDAEYHIVAVDKLNGQVKAISDGVFNGYTNDDLIIRYSNVVNPIMKIKYSDYNEENRFTPVINEPYEIILPFNYKIETFDD